MGVLDRLRWFRDEGYLGVVVVPVGVVIVLTALPLLARIPLGSTAGAALSKEMRWERRSKRNARRAERFVAAATGWWFAALGIFDGRGCCNGSAQVGHGHSARRLRRRAVRHRAARLA